MSRVKVFSALILLGTMMSCSTEESPRTLEDDLDGQLTNAIKAAAPNARLTHFVLPDPSDLSAIPQDPNNVLTPEKVALGRLLYHDAVVGMKAKLDEGMNTYSCASCHHAAAGFQANMAQGLGEGGSGFGLAGEGRHANPAYPIDSIDFQPIRSPTTINTAYQHATLWNGQFGAIGVNAGTEAMWTAGTPKEANNMGFEGVETQALAGLGVHRMDCDEALVLGTDYEALFDAAYPNQPKIYRYTKVKAALAIAAYERTLMADQAPFQQWLKGNHGAMSDQEKRGASMFFGKANCSSCHNGPALNDMDFHALGMNDLAGQDVLGTVDEGTRKGRGGFTGNASDNYKFKTPQLYSLKYSPFYGHGASFHSVREVVEYKNAGQPENADVPDGQLAEQFAPLGLNAQEIDDLTAFIENALDDNNLARYEPLELPSGFCFPVNDPEARVDLGCD